MPKQSQVERMTPDDLKQWRTSRGLSQVDAAKLLRTPLGTIRRWEAGANRIPGIVGLTIELINKEPTR